MANTLTNLLSDAFVAADVVSRELTGTINSVSTQFSRVPAAVGDPIRYHVTPAGNKASITPAMAIPEPTDQTIGNNYITISKAEAAEFGYVGEEQAKLNTGPGYMTVQADQIAQALRKLTNQIESDLNDVLFEQGSRAYGTAGTTPFAASYADISQSRKILVDNGAPTSDLRAVVDTTAGAALRTLIGVQSGRNSEDISMVRQGVLFDPYGVEIRETGQPKTHTAGTASGATTDNAGYAIGATTITLASAGTGTILAGDVITFAGDTNKYVVLTGDADVSNGGTIVLQEPGLRVAMSAATKAITMIATRSGNAVFHRGAVQLIARPPKRPQEGDLALDSRIITDARSGLSFEMSIYGGYRKVRYEVALAWGYKVVQPRHVALLLG